MSDSLWLYRALARFRRLSYRGKIMLMAFLGTHIPLLGLIGYVVRSSAATSAEAWIMVAVALAATLVGTAATLFVLDQLLRPILVTARALRAYGEARTLPELPRDCADEAGRLMADTAETVEKLDAALDELANYDAVTGLANREHFLRGLDRMLREGDSRIALGVVAVTNYERIIETFGGDTADVFIRAVARRLERTAGRGSLVGRIDSRVFAVAIEGVYDPEAVGATFEGLIERIGEAGTDDRLELVPDVTVGVALGTEDGAEAETLLDNALTALAGGRRPNARRVAFFSVASRTAAIERFTLEQDLKRALERDELLLHFQPVVDLTAGRAVGAEALIRWQHPERGMVPPARFIPVAERSGLIDELGLWVLRQACAEAQRWDAALGHPLRIAVNLSARQLQDPGLVAHIEAALAGAGIEASSLELELTETATMADAGRTSDIFQTLREMGVRVAIDDFGTGYASMSYLRNLPFDKLKIDREFVDRIDCNRNSRAICSALVALSDGLGIELLAEGTEREAEVATLRRLGCRLFQGYYFGRPMPSSAFLAHIATPLPGPKTEAAAV